MKATSSRQASQQRSLGIRCRYFRSKLSQARTQARRRMIFNRIKQSRGQSLKMLLLLQSLVVISLFFSCTTIKLVAAHYNEARFKALVYDDDSNDDALAMNAQQLISRSGFSYELYHSIADDGYVTQLIRIINPLANRAKLKRPPVMLFHGASLDQTAYLMASSIQHQPEKYPRNVDVDGPITSSNRSLGFTLANNGYDVWLVGTRGSNEGNQGHVENVTEAREHYETPFALNAKSLRFVRQQREKYFLYGCDEIITYELREQIDRVLALTQSEEVSIISFSISGLTTMVFLAENPEYARRVRVYTQMAPAILADHFTFASKLYWEILDPLQATSGVGFTTSLEGQKTMRKAVLSLSYSPAIRYSLVYNLLAQLFGPSLVYQTNLELNLLGHIFADFSHKLLQQYSQHSVSKRLTKYDFGPTENVAAYGQTSPPEYNISRIEVHNWLVLEGTSDVLADPGSIQRLVETSRAPRHAVRITAPGFNHLDFLGSVENARYVNLPILEQLDKHSNFRPM